MGVCFIWLECAGALQEGDVQPRHGLWLDVLRSPAPGVPLTFRSVKELADFRWPEDQEPSFARTLIQVAGPVVGHIPDVPRNLQGLTPEGYVHSMLHACARQLPQHKDRWNLILRSVPLRFVKEPEDEWIASWNCRNAIAQDFESLGRTAFQMSLEIKLLKTSSSEPLRKVRRLSFSAPFLLDQPQAATWQNCFSRVLILNNFG